jgi:nucleotide-binding universal stress UspA family protein
MFENVLIGIDGRQGGRDAIALARQLAVPDAILTLGHIYAPFLGRGAVEMLAIERRDAEEMLAHERALAGVDARLSVRGPRSVGRGLHELAEEQHADLLVVGSTRHALLGRVLMGDDCRAALNGAPCALAVAPRGYATVPHRMERIGVGYDASPESERAVQEARELAARHQAQVDAFSVVSLEDVKQDKPLPAEWPEAVDELIERRNQELARLDGVQGIAVYGGPREELVAAGWELDLLIVGSRGFGPIGSLFHGSVSRYLVGHATCPLLVLPRRAGAVVGPAESERAADAKVPVVS